MAKQTTYDGILGDLQRLSVSLNANAQELGHLEGSRTKLETLLGRAVDISKQQAALKAGKQEMSRQIRQVAIDGQRLANALRVAVKEHYGPRAEKLVEFGVQPFRGRVRKVSPIAAPVPHPAGPATPGSND
jgi:hypothetical protein